MTDLIFCWCVLILLLLSESSIPVCANAQYKTVPNFCDRNSECATESGELCYWMFDGCTRGQCMCDPITHFEGPGGQCKAVKIGGDFCRMGDICPSGMRCIRDRCTCTHGHMTADRQFCLMTNQKLLGQECEPGYTKCLHKASYGYTESDVWCSYRRECQCQEGYKPDGVSCRKWGIGEWGCARAYHCEGGAICLDGRCVCPTGYAPTAGNTKCGKRGALTNLPVGAQCDEVNELRYCSHGLVCHRCYGHSRNLCVRFMLDPRWSRQTRGGATTAHTSCLTTILPLFLLCLYTCFHLDVR